MAFVYPPPHGGMQAAYTVLPTILPILLNFVPTFSHIL